MYINSLDGSDYYPLLFSTSQRDDTSYFVYVFAYFFFED